MSSKETTVTLGLIASKLERMAERTNGMYEELGAELTVMASHLRELEQMEGLRRAQSLLMMFHQKFNSPWNMKPTLVDRRTAELRLRLTEEECLKEFREGVEEDNLVKIADSIADGLYVKLGDAVTYGIDIWPIFLEVHRSNMSKVWPDGTVHYDDYGKVIKPFTYSRADVAGLLAKQEK